MAIWMVIGLLFGQADSTQELRYSRVYKPRNPTVQFYSTLPGLDLLLNDDFGPLRGRKVGIVTNHTGTDLEGRSIVDVFVESEDIELAVIFSPEHGFSGQVDRGVKIEGGEDIGGLKVYSLYGKTVKPTPDQLAGLDAVIFDIQDIGSRYYTYASTMTLVMDACARDRVPIWVLDRPNPIRGDIISGPLMEEEFSSFVGMHPVPIRHGLTMGELAIMINEAGWLPSRKPARLVVVPMINWSRYYWWDETGLAWTPPSPNIPTPETALAYIGTCLLEGTNISEGRGTYEPFLKFGAPWIEGASLAQKLNRLKLASVEFERADYVPKSIKGMSEQPMYLGEQCGGVRLKIIDREIFDPLFTGVSIIYLVATNYPHQFSWNEEHIDKLWGSDNLRKYIAIERSLAGHPATYAEQRDDFYLKRKPFLIYSEPE
ncbi:exo-beta-N-acetylmuramidase NamZ domain-containing protein [Candidatus Neomarinimicrobiota bacterium]